MRISRTILSWALLLGMLASLPVGAAGRFVCVRGMAKAGPDCPLCGTHAPAARPGPGIGNTCCKFVSARPAPDALLSPTSIERPLLAQVALVPADIPFARVLDHDLGARAGRRDAARAPTSGYLFSVLRL